MNRSARAVPRAHRAWPVLLALLVLAPSAGAALRNGVAPGPELVAPAEGARVSAAGLKLAWIPPRGTVRHVLVVSSTPFDTRGWSAVPSGDAFQVLELQTPVADFGALKLDPETERQFYWAAGSGDARKGRLTFSAARPMTVIPKFANRVQPTPFLATSSVKRGLVQPLATSGDRIRLASGYTIDPRAGEPSLPSGLAMGRETPGAARSYLVYYGDSDPEAMRAAIMRSGGSIVAYIPDRTFLVRVQGPGSLSIDSPNTEWVGLYQPAYKLSRRLDVGAGLPALTEVLAFPDADLDAIGAHVQSLGGTVAVRSQNGINRILHVSLPGTALGALARHPDVQWIEPSVPATFDNEFAQWVVQTRVTNNRRVWDMGLHGEGQILHTSDSGINVGHELFRDPSVPLTTFGDSPTHRKIIGYVAGSTDPRIEFNDHGGASYHGSHTAGTALGSDDGIYDGSPTDTYDTYDGVAKEARIYFSDIGGTLLANSVAAPADLNDLFLPPYTGNAGGAARISSNSWGSAVGGAYTIRSMNVDQFMWNHPDFLAIFSNGNSGSPGSVGSPASAKNSVGAGGSGNGGSATSIYASTSRGPTEDGRRKPTVCAPGSNVRSASTATVNYQLLSGTSMASPAMAGAALLLRQYLMDGWYPTGTATVADAFTPSAALLKAMMVSSGQDDFTSFVAPDSNIGFGRVLLDSTLHFAGDNRRLLLVDNTAGLQHGESIEYQVNVVDGTERFEVALCWTDYPGNPAALKQLVNDLNLTVINGDSTYKGNVVKRTGTEATGRGFAITGGSYDDLNVEEQVLVRVPVSGLWTVRIDGAAINAGPQPFALCITGRVGTNAGTLTLDRGRYGSSSTVEVEVVDTDAGAGPLDLTITSSTEPAGETVSLAKSGNRYLGSIALSSMAPSAGDGTLQVAQGDQLVVTYQDASPATTLVAEAEVEFYGPTITDVSASASSGTGQVRWRTDRNADSRIYWGPTTALGNTASDPVAALDHSIALSGLTIGQTYYYDVESTDLSGITYRDDNGGQHYRFTVQPPADLLLVHSGLRFERPQDYAAAFEQLGWTYDTWTSPLADDPPLGDLASGMRAYQVVWWQPSYEEYPPVADLARDVITSYQDGGGRLVVSAHDLVWALADGASPYYTVARASWVQNTLHTLYLADPPAWTGVRGKLGDPISSAYVATPLPYGEPRPGASGDEVNGSAADGTILYSWESVETTPANCAVMWESNGPKGTAGTAYWGGQKTRLAAMYFEWTRIDTATAGSPIRRDVMQKTLNWLLGRDKPNVVVTAPNGGETLTGDPVTISWTEAAYGGTMVASRSIEYSLDGGSSWTQITGAAGPSPYLWASPPNGVKVLVRVRIQDDGSPALKGSDVSNGQFTIARPNNDTQGPAVVAGSLRANPNPIDNRANTTITAAVNDSLNGGSTIQDAEWSVGISPAAAGSGNAMTVSSAGIRAEVTATMPPELAPAAGTHTLWVRGRDAAGNWGAAQPLVARVNGRTTTDVNASVPRSMQLRQNAPNPVGETTTIAFGLPARGDVDLAIFDLSGRRVRTLAAGSYPAGVHSIVWNLAADGGQRVSPGVYYYRLTSAGRSLEKRMVALR